MAITVRCFLQTGLVLLLLAGLVCLPVPRQLYAEEQVGPTERPFPGLNEVVPQATALNAKLDEARATLQKAGDRTAVYEALDKLGESFKKLEEQYPNWEQLDSWQANRILRAENSYDELRDDYLEQLNIIYKSLEGLEGYRNKWEEEKAFWQSWQSHLRQENVKVPAAVFRQVLTDIDRILKDIGLVSGELLQAQQKYSPPLEVMVSRLSLIDKALDSLRQDTFRRNTYALFEPDYYRQFDRELLAEFRDNLTLTLSLPANFFQKHGESAVLHAISILVIALLLIYRSRQSKPLTEQWTFLFRRPLSAAIFISILLLSNLTNMLTVMPLGWRWMIGILITIAAMRLLNAFYQRALSKKVVRTIAALFIISESLRYFGIPTPVLQLYHVLLCAVTIPACWHLLSRHRAEMTRQLVLIYPIFGIAIIGLLTGLLGFERFTTSLVDATLTTFIILVLLRMALRISDAGVETFMQLEWIRKRHFIEVLGLEQGTRKLQFLFRIVILVNTFFYLLVTWMLFDNVAEARQTMLDYEYAIGEFSLSVRMVVLVIVVLYLTTLISWIIQAFVDSQIMTPKKMELGVKESLKRLTHYGLFTIGFLIAMGMAGLDLQKFTILAGALGVGIGFGLQNIVNNFVSGLILLFERPVKIGDTINIDQEWGTITKIGLRSTVFETFDRSEIIVPNADLISQKVTNWTYTSKIVRVTLPVGVAYGSPLEEVLGILKKAAREHPDVLSYPESSPIFVGFGNSSIDFELRAWIHSVDDRLKVKSELGVLVDRLFREHGIEIPFPQRDLHLRSIDPKLQTLMGARDSRPVTEPEGPTE